MRSVGCAGQRYKEGLRPSFHFFLFCVEQNFCFKAEVGTRFFLSWEEIARAQFAQARFIIGLFAFKMKGFHERWETLDAKQAEGYARIVIESARCGLGFGWERVLAVGRQNRAANGSGRLYTFDFLWIKNTGVRSCVVQTTTNAFARPGASPMSLRKVAGLFHEFEVESHETSMRCAFDNFDDVVFFEEYIPVEDGDEMYQRRVIHSRVIPDSALISEDEGVSRYRDREHTVE